MSHFETTCLPSVPLRFSRSGAPLHTRRSTGRGFAGTALLLFLFSIFTSVQAQPDLYIISGTPTATPNVIPAGGSFMLSGFTVFNKGTASTGRTPFSVGFYLSTNATITSSDIHLPNEDIWIQELFAGAPAHFGSRALRIPSGTAPGMYYIGILADWSKIITESNENNNYVSVQITVESPPPAMPDLSISSGAPTVSPNVVPAGGSFTLSGFTVRNGGTASTGMGFDIGFYLSTDIAISSDDTRLDDIFTSALPAGFSRNFGARTLTIPAGTPRGTYHVGILVDRGYIITEPNENNNYVSVTITVEAAAKPDLCFTSGAPIATPDVIPAGGSFNLSGFTVRNQGAVPTGADFGIGYYLSTNSVVSRSDTRLYDIVAGALAANSSRVYGARTLTIPAGTAAGAYYVGVLVDWNNAISESNESNNYVSVRITVGPPATGSLAINVRDRNGNWPSGTTGRYRLYNSSDKEIQSGGGSSGSIQFTDLPPGSGYYLRVWATPSPATIFGEEFWGRMDGITIQAGSQSVTFTCNTPSVTGIRAYNASSGADVTGGTVRLGTKLRLAVTIANPSAGPTQTLYSRLILDGDKRPAYAFDSGVSASLQIASGESKTIECEHTPSFTQPYYAAAAALIYFSGQPTVSDGEGWSSTPLVSVEAAQENPVPVLSEISPSEKTAGEGSFTLTAKGEKFISSSVVRLDDNDRPTTYVSSTELRAAIPASDIAAVGTHAVTVFTPAPGGGKSNAKTLTVLQVHTVSITSGPSGNPNPVASGGAVTCTVTGACSRGHAVNHAWSADVGSFTNPTSQSCTWTAPVNTSSSSQTYTIAVTISCGALTTSQTYQQVVNSAAEGVVERLSGIPEVASLSQNYPNPFNPQTTIRFGLPHRAQVTLSVYGTLGQEVAQIVNEELEAGYYEVTFDGGGLASGVYFYRFSTGEFICIKRLVLLR